MKGTIKALIAGTAIATLAGCSTMNELQVRETKAHPSWYTDCDQIGKEGWVFWNRAEFAYACGMGESRFEQASESQAYAFAVKGFAERINGSVNSSTVVDINDNTRTTSTRVEHKVTDTVIREHLEVKKYAYELAGTGNVHTYVRIKMPLDTFNRLIQEAKEKDVQ